MPQIARILEANGQYAATYRSIADAKPARRIAVVTCMDARIDVFAALGLNLGDAHVIRNAGARVTDDVIRSLALSANVLNVNTVVLMQHTGCGIEGVTDAELQAQCGGTDVDFLPIDDHEVALRKDIDTLVGTPFLKPIDSISGFVFDMRTGRIERPVLWERS